MIPTGAPSSTGSIPKDLGRQGFFAVYTLLIHPLVVAETDNPGGAVEIQRLGDYAAMDRIALRRLDGERSAPQEVHDQRIIEAALNTDAVLVTRDKGMYGNAVAQSVFCLSFRV